MCLALAIWANRTITSLSRVGPSLCWALVMWTIPNSGAQAPTIAPPQSHFHEMEIGSGFSTMWLMNSLSFSFPNTTATPRQCQPLLN